MCSLLVRAVKEAPPHKAVIYLYLDYADTRNHAVAVDVRREVRDELHGLAIDQDEKSGRC